MLDEMKEAGRSKQSGTRVKKKSSSGCLVIKKKVADTVGGVSGFSDSSSRMSRSSKEKKRRRVVESDSESSDYSSETTHKRSAVYKEFETEKRASSGLDVFEFDEYDGFEDVRTRKEANGGKHRWNSYRQSGDQMESGNGGSRPTYEARNISPLEMEDDDFDLPLSVLSKKYRSSSDKPIRLQGKNGVLKVMVNKNKQMSRSNDKKEAEDQKEPKPRVQHKKKLDKNDDHRDAGESSKSKEKGGMKSITPVVRKSSKEVNESDTVMQSKSNSRVEAVKKPENVKKVKEKENMVKHDSGTEKQILREKIKNMLLGAGWTIDYRPRKKKNYLDAIYTNPAGTAYWSIIKAYEVLQKEEEGNAEDSDNFTPLPVEILGKLARQTQKKTERELKTKRKDEGNSRNAKRAMEDTDSDYEEELNSHGRRKSRRLGRCTLLVRDSNKVLENDGISPYSGKRTILAWLIDSGVVDMSEHVEYMNARRTRILQKGRITKDGIHCGCCSKILTVLKFEQHSGSKLCNPFPNIFLESGKSLMQCQIDAWNKLGELEQKGFYTVDVDGDDPNDDTCSVCGDGGDLICCDGCPSTFHQSCLDIEMLPEGDWLCPNCSCKYCEMAGGNCPKDGGITEASLHTCCLCYKKYHESCRPGIDVKPHEPNSLDFSFCGHKCHEVYIPLQKLIGVKHELDSGFSWSLIHRSDSDSLTDGEVSRRMECNSMLAVAMSLMDECFLPFTDKRSGINLIRNVVFNCGSNLRRLNYSGFYTAILEREEEVVCAASIRFHGTQLAEMPFIGTRHIYRRQGMCRRLLSAIESALSALQVDKLIIPAVAEHMNTWTDVFGFQPLEESHKQELKSMNMLVFPRTDMLQKPIPEGKKTLEVGGVSALSKKPELISANVAELSDKNGTRDFMDDASKETLPINPPVKAESPCEPQLQLPAGKESDSIHSHSSSKVNEIDVQNGNGINPLPSHNDIPCESHKQVPSAPCSEHILQQSGQESDSHSNSKIDGIAVTNPKEGSCGSERNRKQKERVIPGATNGLSNNTADSALSKNVELIISSNVGTQEVGVSLDLETHPINFPVKDESHQLPGKESDSLHSHSNSKASIETNPLPTHVHDPIQLHVHDPIQLSKKESLSSMDVQTQGNNSAVPRKSESSPSNVVEFSDKTATIDSGSQECVVSLSKTPVKDEQSDSIHSHSDSKVHEVDLQNGNRTNSKQGSCGSEMNRRKEKERGTLGAVSDSEATNTNDLSGVHYSVMEVDDCSATSFSIKQELINDKTAITDSGVPFDDTHTDTKTTDSGLHPAQFAGVASHDNIVSSETPDKITAAPSSEPEIHSHSESKVNEIATDPEDDGSALELISSTVAEAEFSDNTTITNSGSPIKDDDILVPVSELVKTHFVEGYTYTRVVGKEYDSTRSHSDEVAVQNGNPLHDAILSVSEKESFSCVDAANNSLDDVAEISKKNGSQESGVPLDDGCSLHASIIYPPGKDESPI